MNGQLTNLSIGRYGRFANGLFQIMGLIGIAKRQVFSWGIEPWTNWDHKERFGSSEDIEIWRHLAHALPQPVSHPYAQVDYNWGYQEFNLPPGNYDIRGHFQSPLYFDHAMDEIRYWLRFKDEPADRFEVAVHIRRGDYDDAYHPRLAVEYYAPALSRFPDRKFIVFSDDHDAAVKLMHDCGVTTFELAKGNYIEDFKLMKSCHSFICANSSYSYAAALLANQPGKQMVLPRRWFGPAWGNPDGMTTHLYHPNAIIL